MNATETYDFTLPGSLTVTDLQGQSVRIDSLAQDNKLILRIRESFCEDCVKAELRQIDSIGNPSDIIILATYSNLRIVKIIAQKYNIKVPIYYLPNSTAQEIFSRNDRKGIPYLFVLRPNLQCESCFFPSKLFPKFSARFYKLMIEKLSFEKEKAPFFPITSRDLGKIKKGKTYEVMFPYRNAGKKPFVIHDIRLSCDCVAPIWDKKPLRQGEQAKLIIRFTPKGHGYTFQSIMVYHNLSRTPIRLTIKGEAE